MTDTEYTPERVKSLIALHRTAYTLSPAAIAGCAIRSQLRLGQRVTVLVGGHEGDEAEIVDIHNGRYTIYTSQFRWLPGYRAEQLQAKD